MSTNPDNLAIQILFGRYRDWGALTWTHLVILGSVLGLVAFVYSLLLRSRLGSYIIERKKLKKREALPLTQRDLGRGLYHVHINEMYGVQSLLALKFQPEKTECGDRGWGGEDSEWPNVHFATSIAKSYVALESTAVSRRPGPFHRDSRTTREYMELLQKAFPGLQSEECKEACREYIDTYERAVFSSYNFTAEEYQRFRQVIGKLLEQMKKKV